MAKYAWYDSLPATLRSAAGGGGSTPTPTPTGAMVYKGAWDVTKTNAVGDVVTSNGHTYVCNTPTTAGGAVAPISFVGVTNGFVNAQGPLDLILASGAAVGDLAVLVACYYLDTNALPGTLPTGFTYPGTLLTKNTNCWYAVATKALGSSEIGVGKVTIPSQPQSTGGANLYIFRGAQVQTGKYVTSNTSTVAPSLSGVSAGYVVASCFLSTSGTADFLTSPGSQQLTNHSIARSPAAGLSAESGIYQCTAGNTLTVDYNVPDKANSVSDSAMQLALGQGAVSIPLDHFDQIA